MWSNKRMVVREQVACCITLQLGEVTFLVKVNCGAFISSRSSSDNSGSIHPRGYVIISEVRNKDKDLIIIVFPKATAIDQKVRLHLTSVLFRMNLRFPIDLCRSERRRSTPHVSPERDYRERVCVWGGDGGYGVLNTPGGK